jgi:hypothetical protein
VKTIPYFSRLPPVLDFSTIRDDILGGGENEKIDL